MKLEDRLRGVLRDAEPFTTNTRYSLDDRGVAQGALAFQAGFALRAFYATAAENGEEDDEGDEDPRRNNATALYVGAAPKYLQLYHQIRSRILGGELELVRVEVDVCQRAQDVPRC